MVSICDKYGYTPSEVKIHSLLDSVEARIGDYMNEEILKRCFSMMDLTTLKTDDTQISVSTLVQKANKLLEEYPSYPLPASICVYPNFASVVRNQRRSDSLHVTTVSSCFPSAQSFLEVKKQECALAVENGADEIDIVLALNAFLDDDFERAFEEISSMKQVIDQKANELGRKVLLKVILETGLLSTPDKIASASFLAMEAGADFIKTSTGKVEINATPYSAAIMCQCIKVFYEKTGRKVGFKAAGGISSASDALRYYAIAETILGPEWTNKDLLRLGVSRLGNSLMSAIEEREIKYF